MTQLPKKVIDQLKTDQSPEAQALREGGIPELKRQVEAAMEEMKDAALPIPALKKKYGNLTRKKPTLLSMAVGFGIAYNRADQRVKG